LARFRMPLKFPPRSLVCAPTTVQDPDGVVYRTIV